MEANGGVFKKKRVYFSQVSNHALRDKQLSLKAKGLYALIQSYITIEGFTLYKNTLIKNCKEKKDAFERAWKELKDKGYLLQAKKHNHETGVFYYEYELLDIPANIQDLTAHTPVFQGVDNPGGGEPGVYNNTCLPNTDLKNIKGVHNVPNRHPEDTHSVPSSPLTTKDLKDLVQHYYTKYAEDIDVTGHPRLKAAQRARVKKELAEFARGERLNLQDMRGLVDKHFERDMDTDWNINHFATDGVLINLVRL